MATAEERRIAMAAQENDDCLNLPLLKKLGYSESTGEQILREWETRGWTAKDRARGNKRCLTESEQPGSLSLNNPRSKEASSLPSLRLPFTIEAGRQDWATTSDRAGSAWMAA